MLARGDRRLSDVVAFDEPHLGDLRGVDVVHLQCHIGTGTISLARLGARVTGLFAGRARRGEIARALGEPRRGLRRNTGLRRLRRARRPALRHGEIVQALIDAGLTITRLVEHDVCEWQCFESAVFDGRWWRLLLHEDDLPLMYTPEAHRGRCAP